MNKTEDKSYHGMPVKERMPVNLVCGSCESKWNSPTDMVGTKHKGCLASPRGRFRKPGRVRE